MTLRKYVLAAALALAAHGAAHAHDFKAGAIEIDDLWMRATAPGQSVGGGYMEIDNDGKQADRLLSITSPIADSVEMHETRTENGVSSMRATGPVTIPPDSEIKFAPGGYHLMFLKLKQPLKQGDEVPATLVFEHAGAVDVRFKVKPIGYKAGSGGAMNHDMGHGMGDMGNMGNMGNMPGMNHGTMQR
ncbi:copper chaperone PCu(A)C [Achromobacter aloeverae]